MDNTILIIVIIIAVAIIIYLYYQNRKCRLAREFLIRMAQLWTQHLYYTRQVVEAFFNNAPNLQILQNRLLQNQRDLGNLFGTVYGPLVGTNITNAMTQHILTAVKVLTALKANNQNDQKKYIDEFYANARDIGNYINRLKNSSMFTQHMKTHIDTLVATINAYIKKNYADDIKFTDMYLNDGIQMSFDISQ